MAFDPQLVFADRIGGVNFGKDTIIYKFEKIKRDRRQFESENPGVAVINIGVGEHDGLEPQEVSDIIGTEVRAPRNKGYPDNGIEEFQIAAANYLNRTMGLKLPTDSKGAKEHVIHAIGSKGALSLLPLAFVNRGDGVVMTTPGYPVFGTHTKYLEGKVIPFTLVPENGFLPNLKDLEGTIQAFNRNGPGRVKVACFNYPNNPTGADAPLEFWQEVANLAHKYNFVIVHDAAYVGLNFGDKKPTGILQANGGLEVGVQIHSMSKAFNMIGRRIAFVAGNPKLISAYGNIKDNSDSGQDSAIQRGAAFALEHPEFTEQIAAKYERRLSGLIEVLNKHGFNAKMPAGSFFLYTKAPTGTKDMAVNFKSAEEAAKYMLTRQGISTVPWDDAGAYIRCSATFDAGPDTYAALSGDAEADSKVMAELDSRLGKLQLRFN